MQNQSKKFNFINFVVCFGLLFSFVFTALGVNNLLKNKKSNAIMITEEEAKTEQVDNLRYGYNVTSGKVLADDGLQINAPILKDIYNSGLYQYINKIDDTQRKLEANNYIANSAKEVAEKSGASLNGGINTKIRIVSMDVNTNFKHSTSLSSIYQERYEVYNQKIYRKSFIIQDGVNLKDYLTDSFKSDLYSITDESDALMLFNKYGTHLFTGFQYGGLLMITNYQVTNSESVSLDNDIGLESKMGVAIANMKTQTNFSFSEQYTSIENTSSRTSTYNCIGYGGDSVTGMTLDQLFTYNGSIVDGKGNYVYDRWVSSINDGKGLSIIGTPNGSSAIPLWDLLESGNNEIRTYLTRAYASLCGEKLDEYLKKYPTVSRTIKDDSTSTGSYEMKGYTIEFNGTTTYFNDEDNSINDNVFRDSIIYMNYSDNIPAGKKQWKITKGSDYASVKDKIAGVFQVNSNTGNGKEFTVSLYSGDTFLYSKVFKIVQDVFSGGDGSEKNPYLISNKDDFLYFCRESAYWGKHFKLTNNIDFGNSEISCIGNENNQFSGVFDGNNCYLRNFKILNPIDSSLALFSYSSGSIKNLFIENEIVGYKADGQNKTDILIKYAGGLVGYNTGSISNCKINNLIIDVQYNSTENHTMCVGGLIGVSNIAKTSSAKIEEIGLSNISIKGSLNNEKQDKTEFVFAGGLIGVAYTQIFLNNIYLRSITQIFSNVKSNDEYSYAGGLFGQLETKSATIQYVVIDKIATLKAGVDATKGKQNYARHSFAGNIVDETNISFSILNCYFTQNDNGTGLNSDKIQIQDTITYASASKLSSSIWIEDENHFPVLRKQVFDKNNAVHVVSDSGKRVFYYGQSFNIAGLQVEGQYSNGGDIIKIDNFMYDASAFNSNEVGNYVIIITAMGYQTKYLVEVRKIDVVGIDIIARCDKFYVDESPNIEDYEIKYILENGDKVSLSESMNFINKPNDIIEISKEKYVLGNNKIYITCGNLSGIVIVDAIERVVEKIEITNPPEKLVYFEGQKFNTKGLVVKATYDDKTSEIINNKELEIMGETISVGENNLILSYDNYITCNLNVTGETLPKIKFKITFKDYDGTILSEDIYEDGDIVIEPEYPTREADNTYTYEFKSWDNEVTVVNGEKTYTAVYTQTYIEYTIKFVDYNGRELSSRKYHYGDTVEELAHPIREADNTYTYEFKSWDNEVTVVNGEKTYTAVYTQTYIEYTIKFVDYDGRELSLRTYHYGDIVIEPEYPTREVADDYVTYIFTGWGKEIEKVVKNEVYTAQYQKYVGNLGLLLKDLNEVKNKPISLSTYDDIINLKQKSLILENDELIEFNLKIQELIDKYLDYVKLINEEYEKAQEIEKENFVSISNFISYSMAMAYVDLIGKRGIYEI